MLRIFSYIVGKNLEKSYLKDFLKDLNEDELPNGKFLLSSELFICFEFFWIDFLRLLLRFLKVNQKWNVTTS